LTHDRENERAESIAMSLERKWAGSSNHIAQNGICAAEMEKRLLDILISHSSQLFTPEGCLEISQEYAFFRTPGKQNTPDAHSGGVRGNPCNPWEAKRPFVFPHPQR